MGFRAPMPPTASPMPPAAGQPGMPAAGMGMQPPAQLPQNVLMQRAGMPTPTGPTNTMMRPVGMPPPGAMPPMPAPGMPPSRECLPDSFKIRECSRRTLSHNEEWQPTKPTFEVSGLNESVAAESTDPASEPEQYKD